MMQTMEPVQADESKKPVQQNANLGGVSSTCLVKAHRDIQRQISSLTRLQSLCTRRKSDAKSSIQSAFDQLYKELNYRQAKLLAEAEEAEISTNAVLAERLQIARSLMLLVEDGNNIASQKSDILRVSVKKFVSERTIDQTISCAERFCCNMDDMLEKIRSFGRVKPFTSPYSYTMADVPSLEDTGKVNQTEAQNGPNAGETNKEPSQTTKVEVADGNDEASRREMAVLPADDVKTAVDQELVDVDEFRHITEGIVRLLHGKDVDVLEKSPEAQRNDSSSALESITQQQQQLSKDIVPGPAAGCDTGTRPVPRATGRGGIIRLPSMDVVSTAANRQLYCDSSRRQYNQRSYVPSDTMHGGGGRGDKRRYSGPSTTTTDHQRSNNDSHHNGCGSRSRSGSVVSMSRDEANGFKHHWDVSQVDQVTMRPRRSSSVHADAVDEEGFTLVTHSRRGSGNRGGHRPRGSSGDSTSNAKYFYGHESLQFRQQQQQRGGGGERFWRGVP